MEYDVRTYFTPWDCFKKNQEKDKDKDKKKDQEKDTDKDTDKDKGVCIRRNLFVLASPPGFLFFLYLLFVPRSVGHKEQLHKE